MACVGGKCMLTSQVRRLRLEAGMDAMDAGDLAQAETLLRQSVTLAENEAGLDVVTANASTVWP